MNAQPHINYSDAITNAVIDRAPPWGAGKYAYAVGYLGALLQITLDRLNQHDPGYVTRLMHNHTRPPQ